MVDHGRQMPKVFKLESSGIEVEIGKHAFQADGAAWIRCGKNVLLATAVVSKDAKEYAGFFPLTVEYRERPVAAGKIPGGYIKREGRLSDSEILSCRTIDRGIRPLFPKFYSHEVQVMASLLSSDGTFPSEVLGVLGSSIALTIAKTIPFLGPIGAAQVQKLADNWVINAGEASEASKDHFTVVGTADGICMVEGYCDHIDESTLLDLLARAHEEIKKQVAWQLEIQKALGIKTEMPKFVFDWHAWEAKVRKVMPTDWSGLIGVDKATFSERVGAARKVVYGAFAKEIEAKEVGQKELDYLFDAVLKETVPSVLSAKQQRFDGRKFDQVRPISCEVGFLPGTHGSALFTRGETQALSSVTLGATQDAQKVETLLDGIKERTFMLHYNFPPFSTGEIKPLRGVGRREIGHGYLAENSFKNVLPAQEGFPYTIRSVVDILASNGSSSMASVCATSLSLMDAGVPLTEAVAGIAMGLCKDANGNYFVLTDILGSEDAYGLMDFKVAGNEKGILSFQMDIKERAGLPREVLARAMAAARIGIKHILGEMAKALMAPRAELAAHAPRVATMTIDKEKIGALIGPGGKTIREISTKADVTIDVNDDGMVKIFSKSGESAALAKGMIKAITGDIEVGATYDGLVRSIVEFGIFVQLVPGKDGLVHVSSIAREKQRKLEELAPVGSILKVVVTANDTKTGRIRLVAPSLEK